MSGPFIFIATNRLEPGKLGDERKRVPGLVDFVEATEPRLIGFNEYPGVRDAERRRPRDAGAPGRVGRAAHRQAGPSRRLHPRNLRLSGPRLRSRSRSAANTGSTT